MELTREMIEIAAKEHDSKNIHYIAHKRVDNLIGLIAEQLLAEMDKPKVWDDAPEWATKAVVNWSAPTHYSGVYKEYTRTIPKSPEREIAERIGNEKASKVSWNKDATEYMINAIETAINEYKALNK